MTRGGLVALAVALALGPAGAQGQQPLYPGAPPRTVEPQSLPPLEPAPEAPRSASSPAGIAPPPSAAAPLTETTPEAPASRVFCDQQVTFRLADRATVAERYRPFIGIWSDASWTPELCAALIVATVSPEGTATILYAFGPMGSNPRRLGGVLNGTGIIRDGELRFQNSDGSQFAFRRLYGDLSGTLVTPKGQTHEAIFKKTM